MTTSYTDMIAKFSIGSAHPGGLAVTKKIFEKISNYPLSTIIDVGCGTGKTIQYIADHSDSVKLIGIDRNPNMVAKAQTQLESYPNVQIRLADVSDLPIETSTIDCLISESVTTFTDIPVSLQEYNRILCDNGVLCLLEMTANYPVSTEVAGEINAFYGIYSLLTEEEWVNAAEIAGFDLIQLEQVAPNLGGSIDFHAQQDIDPIYFKILAKHAQLIEKYRDLLSARLYFFQKQSVGSK